MTETRTAKRLAEQIQHIRDCERDLHITMVMAHQDGMSLRAIAEQVGKSPETCRTIIGAVLSGDMSVRGCYRCGTVDSGRFEVGKTICIDCTEEG